MLKYPPKPAPHLYFRYFYSQSGKIRTVGRGFYMGGGSGTAMSETPSSSAGTSPGRQQYGIGGPDELVEAGEGVYRTYHDMSTDGLTTTIGVALAEVSGERETELISDFSAYADPDALDRLFRTLPGARTREEGRIVLHVREYRVTVHSDGTILIEAN